MGKDEVLNFSALYREYARDVHRFALFLSGDNAAADDIVSETFVRVWNARERVDLTTVKGYLFTIARNLYLQERRHVARRRELDETTVSREPGQDRITEAQRELQAVLAALQELPEVDRAAVLMRADDGLSFEEIGAALGITSVAARVKVHRARLLLAKRAGVTPADSKKGKS